MGIMAHSTAQACFCQSSKRVVTSRIYREPHMPGKSCWTFYSYRYSLLTTHYLLYPEGDSQHGSETREQNGLKSCLTETLSSAVTDRCALPICSAVLHLYASHPSLKHWRDQ